MTKWQFLIVVESAIDGSGVELYKVEFEEGTIFVTFCKIRHANKRQITIRSVAESKIVSWSDSMIRDWTGGVLSVFRTKVGV